MYVEIKCSTLPHLKTVREHANKALTEYKKTDFGNGWLGNLLHYIGVPEYKYSTGELNEYDVAGKVRNLGFIDKENCSFLICVEYLYSPPYKAINEFFKTFGADVKFL